MINGIDWTAHGPGHVDVRTTYAERRREVENWRGDPWGKVIAELVGNMEYLDPNFDLVQVKAKFNELRVYFSTQTEHESTMQAMVDKAAKDCWEIDHADNAQKSKH